MNGGVETKVLENYWYQLIPPVAGRALVVAS